MTDRPTPPPPRDDVPPPFPSLAAIRTALRGGYGIEAETVEEIEVGADAAARAWRVMTAEGQRLFLKLRLGVRPAAILLPRHLHDVGMPEPVAAASTVAGGGWLDIEGWSAVVMPYVDGPTAIDVGLDLARWRDLGAFAARLHGSRPPAERGDRPWRGPVRTRSDRARPTDRCPRRRSGPDAARRRVDGGPRRLADAATDDWRLIELSERVAASIRGRGADALRASIVPCHADLHAGNILLEDGRIRVVDWDESLLAPRERDLMFVRGSVVAGRVTDEQADAFELGYGPSVIDRELLAHYRVDWAVQDVAGYAWEVLVRPDRIPPTRPRARRRFEGQFDPGGQVDGALAIAAEIGLA